MYPFLLTMLECCKFKKLIGVNIVIQETLNLRSHNQLNSIYYSTRFHRRFSLTTSYRSKIVILLIFRLNARKNKSAIINIGSELGLKPSPRCAMQGSTKGYGDRLSNSLNY